MGEEIVHENKEKARPNIQSKQGTRNCLARDLNQQPPGLNHSAYQCLTATCT